MTFSTLEIVAAIIGFIYLVLEYKASAWLWLFGIISPILYTYEFYINGMYANMAIQIYYVAAAAYGIMVWKGLLKSKSESKELPISSMPKRYTIPTIAISVILCIDIPLILKYFTDSNIWLLDGISTALSIVGMWMLAQKYYQQWIVWIIVEPIIIATALQAEMYATALLYVVYTVIAVMGYFKWKREAKRNMTNTGTKIIETLNTDNIDVVVLANGEYPSHHIPLSLINKGLPIVCCDGAIEKLDSLGILPLVVVGDGDSIPQHLCDKYSNCWHYIPDQETNDLTKATTYCINHGFKHIAIIGATGMREDHTLGNISLLANYGKQADVRMFTDYGVFVAVFDSAHFRSFAGQQISIFNLQQENYINAEGLLYPIKHRNFAQWWEGTLNESTTNTFLLKLKGEVIVFQTYEKK